METKKPTPDAPLAERIEYVLASVLTRLCDIDQKIDHVIESLHDHLYRERKEEPDAEDVR